MIEHIREMQLWWDNWWFDHPWAWAAALLVGFAVACLVPMRSSKQWCEDHPCPHCGSKRACDCGASI